jgi:hypothetical protein
MEKRTDIRIGERPRQGSNLGSHRQKANRRRQKRTFCKCLGLLNFSEASGAAKPLRPFGEEKKKHFTSTI